jgi:hypothetical protein
MVLQMMQRRAFMNSGLGSALVDNSGWTPVTTVPRLGRQLTRFGLMSALLILGGMYATPSLAQTAATGAIAGVVTDPSGAVVENAKIVVRSETTGDSRSAISASNGTFVVSLLPPGAYTVRASRDGFKELVRTGLTIHVTETAVANFLLSVGAPSEVVTVTSQAELLDTHDPALGKVTSELTVSSLPLVTRNYTQIIGLSPGVATEVTNATALGRGTGSDAAGANGFSVHGGSTNDNNYQVNGVEVNDLMGSGSFSGGIAVPNPDTIQEFKVQTGQYDASYGRNAGANVDLVTKRGTNTIHGTAFEFFRNDVLNANDYFLNENGQPRPVIKQNQFGGSLGGPILRDKLFYFGSYQGTRQRNGLGGGNCISTVLSPALTEDRSAAALGALFNGPTEGAIAADGSNISPQSLALLNRTGANGQFLIPTPQTVDASQPFFTQGSSTFSQTCPFTEDQFLVSIDYLYSTKSSVSGRFFYSNDSQTASLPTNGNISGSAVPGFPQANDNQFRVFSLTHTYTLTPRVINQATIGYHRLVGAIDQSEPFTYSDLGVTAPDFINPFPEIGVVGSFQTGGNGQGLSLTQNKYSMSDSVLWSSGRHLIHFGGGVERAQINQTDFHFFGGIEFPDYTQFLLGSGSFTLDVPGLFDRYYRTWDWNLFAQDDIKISPQFTINLGLRYERLGDLADELGRNASFDPARADHTGAGSQAGYIVASNLTGVDLPPGVIRAPNEAATYGLGQNTWSPRVGFAWQLAGAQVVLRGGYGIYYSRTTAQPVLQELTGPPFGQIRFIQGLNIPFAEPFPPAPALPSFPAYTAATCDIPLLAGDGCLSFVNVSANVKPPVTQNYSLNTQVELLPNLALEIGYQGARGTRLWEFRNFNQAGFASPEHPINGETENTFFNITPRTPVPGISPLGAGQVMSSGGSWYNALVTSLSKRFSHGLQLLASYTWSSALGTSQEFATGTQLGGVALGDQNNPRARYGWDDFVRPHRFVFSGVYQLPGFDQKRSGIGKLLRGWSLAGVTTIQSGQRLTVSATNAQNVFGVVTDRAPFSNAPGCNNQFVTSGSVQSKLTEYINTPCFDLTLNSYPIIGADGIGTGFGTSGIGEVVGPNQNNWDIAFIKRTVLSKDDRVSLDFRAELFNAFNHPQFANPALDAGLSAPELGLVASNPGFGQITAMSTNPRIIQLALKLSF